LSSAQVLGRTDWILYTHLALAKIHRAVPERARRRYAVFLHGIEAWKALSAREKDVLIGADLRLANSNYTARRIMTAHPDIGPVDACPLALLPMASTDPREAASSLFGPHAVLAVGRMDRAERYKGHDQLIEAWPLVLEAVPDAQLVIAGGGDDVERLADKAKTGAVAQSIRFTGFVTDQELDRLYRSTALFALPSRAEGFGLVYLEAMSRRLACIGSIHDAAADVIVDGETGRLVDQDKPGCLAAVISELLMDGEKRRRMGEGGHRRVTSEFSFARFKARLRTLLHADRTAALGVSL
jgi:phosphatidylinositol alpha-1,6-mannosyltransferase